MCLPECWPIFLSEKKNIQGSAHPFQVTMYDAFVVQVGYPSSNIRNLEAVLDTDNN